MSEKNDVTKLPKWAQDRIKQLEGSVAHYKTKAYQVEEGETNVWVSWLMETYYLPEDSIVMFKLKDGQTMEVRHDEFRDGLAVRVKEGAINVRPQSSNVVLLRREAL